MTTLLASDLEQSGFHTVIIAGVDMQGRLFGKRMPVRRLARVQQDGIHVCTCVYGWDVDQNLDGLRVEFAGYHTGWHDFRLVPDLTTLRPAAWLDGTAICLGDSLDEATGELLPVAPRTILRRQVDALDAEGLTATVATELEFFLYRGTPADLRAGNYRDLVPTTSARSDYLITEGDALEDFFAAVRSKLEASGVPVELAQAEYGLGQWEINLEYGDPVETADRHVLFKTLVKHMAAKAGMTATFMPRPLTEDMGSSCHIHSALRRADGTALFHDQAAAHTATRQLLAAVAGVLENAPAVMPWYAPTVNGWRRVLSQDFAGNGLSWGFDNRTTTCRVITGGPHANRVETRLPGSDVNPHLAVAAVLASVRDGLRRDADPGPPHRTNAYADQAGEHRLPETLAQAAGAFRDSDFTVEAFGKDVVSHYYEVAMYEWRTFLRTVSDFDRMRYLERI